MIPVQAIQAKMTYKIFTTINYSGISARAVVSDLACCGEGGGGWWGRGGGGGGEDGGGGGVGGGGRGTLVSERHG